MPEHAQLDHADRKDDGRCLSPSSRTADRRPAQSGEADRGSDDGRSPADSREPPGVVAKKRGVLHEQPVDAGGSRGHRGERQPAGGAGQADTECHREDRNGRQHPHDARDGERSVHRLQADAIDDHAEAARIGTAGLIGGFHRERNRRSWLVAPRNFEDDLRRPVCNRLRQKHLAVDGGSKCGGRDARGPAGPYGDRDAMGARTIELRKPQFG